MWVFRLEKVVHFLAWNGAWGVRTAHAMAAKVVSVLSLTGFSVHLHVAPLFVVGVDTNVCKVLPV